MFTAIASVVLAIGQSGAAPASEPEAPSPPDIETVTEEDADILVEGEHSPHERRVELRKMASDVLRNPRVGRNLGTYFDPICPKVFGLPEEFAQPIEARMRANAEELGANRRTPSENCNHNISVIFVPPEKGSPEEWLDEDSEMLDHLLSWQKNNVLEEEGPVRSWTFNFVRTADGFSFPDVARPSPSDAANYGNRLAFASRLRSPITVAIGGSVILIELAAAQNKTVNQLADYATIRTFANTGGVDPDTIPPAPTILTLFQEDNPPRELTTFDRALISKLYDTSRRSLESRYYSNIAARAFEMEQSEGAPVGGN